MNIRHSDYQFITELKGKPTCPICLKDVSLRTIKRYEEHIRTWLCPNKHSLGHYHEVNFWTENYLRKVQAINEI